MVRTSALTHSEPPAVWVALTAGATSSSPGPVGITPAGIFMHLFNLLGALHLAASHPGISSQLYQVLHKQNSYCEALGSSLAAVLHNSAVAAGSDTSRKSHTASQQYKQHCSD